MVCGRCWPTVSGGVPDGDADHPHYQYGGLWRNRAAARASRANSRPLDADATGDTQASGTFANLDYSADGLVLEAV